MLKQTLIALPILLTATHALAMLPDKPSKANPSLRDKPPINFEVTKQKQIECLAVAMVGEAKHTSAIAMVDVGKAIMTRTNHAAFVVKDPCQAVYQRKQFSFLIVDVEQHLKDGKTTQCKVDKKGKSTCKKYDNWDVDWDKVDFAQLHESVFTKFAATNAPAMAQAVELADRLLYENEQTPIVAFTNYYASYLDGMKLTPEWAKRKDMAFVKAENDHKFYLIQ